jgi:hypothetical protein
MRASTTVVVDPYTDADVLDDYTAYYARCFSAFGRRCKRLHFFRRALNDQSFRELVRMPDQGQENGLQPDYLWIRRCSSPAANDHWEVYSRRMMTAASDATSRSTVDITSICSA